MNLDAYLDYNDGATANLTWFTFFVDFAQTAPFAQFFVGIDTDQRNLMFVTQCRDQFLDLWFFTAFGQDSQKSVTPMNTIETIIDIFVRNNVFVW